MAWMQLGGEEQTRDTSLSKVLTTYGVVIFMLLMGSGRPFGNGKDHIEFKLLCGWLLMNAYLLITVGANGVLVFLLYVTNVELQMRLSSMCYEIALVQHRYG
jgi:hypothetical protein